MKRTRSIAELALKPRNSGERTSQWLRDSIRSAIQTGALKAGQRLPSSRDLARSCSVARGTVIQALDDLKAEGYLSSAEGSGTFVSESLPDHFLNTSEAPRGSQKRLSHIEPRLSEYAKRLTVISHFINPLTVAFRTNLPALDFFPTEVWAQTASRRLRRLAAAQLLGFEPRGFLPLRNALSDYLRSARAVNCEPEQIFITSGIQESLDLVTRILVNPGDKVLMEDPGYQVAFATFQAAGANIISIPIDEHGASPAAASFSGTRLMYLTPGHQFPTGVTMPVGRRMEIIGRARREGTFVFEDDYDSEFRYSGNPLPSMQGMDTDGLVIFAGSFNKTLFPSLRLGYVVVPPSLIEPFTMSKAIHTRHHPMVDQAVLSDFIEGGHFASHLRRMREIYTERLEALKYEVKLQLAGAIELSSIEAGLQTVGWCKTTHAPETIAALALERKVDVVPLSRYSRVLPIRSGIQIGFAAVDPQSIAFGVRTLAEVFDTI